MQFRHADGSVVQLAYCTNVHPAESLGEVMAQLDRFCLPVRESLGWSRLGLGLWLGRPVASALLADPVALRRLRAELDARGLAVVTLNGFPYEAFSAPVVKRKVYRPDWSETARLDYTCDIARVLTALMPEDLPRGSVSTLPLGWRTPWFTDRQESAQANLDQLARDLAKLQDETGRTVRVGLEPEPGCVVETAADVVAALPGLDGEWLGLCVDACHVAVSFDDVAGVLAAAATAGLPVVKTQASTALHVPDPQDLEARRLLEAFVEPRFLHQARESAGGRLQARDDLDAALAGSKPLPGRSAWRVHFHLPLHADPPAPLRSTRPELEATLRALVGGPSALTDVVEVETYTWDVIPADQRRPGDAGLVEGLAAELTWAREQLLSLGLQEIA